ncbi:hypothetical protein [Candidatus Nitrososphaera sp. FF02]|uniref:hypothetical protein n=1 Tax=Candidatus Nitrososphaera sp. FF02 TaxID=3398226 RepID=UPI0039E80874
MSSSQDVNRGESMHQASAQWAEIIGQLFDRLTGKGASVTYTFDNLVIDMPRAQGPNGQDLGSAKWTVNGRVIITAEAHRTPEQEMQSPTAASSA